MFWNPSAKTKFPGGPVDYSFSSPKEPAYLYQPFFDHMDFSAVRKAFVQVEPSRDFSVTMK